MGTSAADALRRLWPTHGHEVGTRFDAAAVFRRDAPLILDIGSGMGDATIAMARADPDRDFLAVDVHTPGLGALLVRAETLGLTNVRAARGDALELLRDDIGDGELDAIHVFFPDPWPKTRHHKRRIIAPGAVALMRRRLRVGGVLHTATDWPHYAEQMLQVLSADPGLRVESGSGSARLRHRPVTKYERRALAAGRPVTDLVSVRIDTTGHAGSHQGTA